MSLYIDGVIKDTEKTITAGTRLVGGVPSTNMMLRVGADAVSGAYGYMYIRDFVIYNTTQLPYVGVFPPLVGGIEAGTVNITSQYGGLMLPTVGGTPSLLNFYEEYSWSTTAGEVYSPALSVSFNFIRIGKIIVIRIPLINGTATVSSHIETGVVPDRFRPVGDSPCWPVYAQDNSINIWAMMYYSPLTFKFNFVREDYLSFTGAGATGVYPTFISYMAA